MEIKILLKVELFEDILVKFYMVGLYLSYRLEIKGHIISVVLWPNKETGHK